MGKNGKTGKMGKKWKSGEKLIEKLETAGSHWGKMGKQKRKTGKQKRKTGKRREDRWSCLETTKRKCDTKGAEDETAGQREKL